MVGIVYGLSTLGALGSVVFGGQSLFEYYKGRAELRFFYEEIPEILEQTTKSKEVI
jgi:hypothetical protein